MKSDETITLVQVHFTSFTASCSLWRTISWRLLANHRTVLARLLTPFERRHLMLREVGGVNRRTVGNCFRDLTLGDYFPACVSCNQLLCYPQVEGFVRDFITNL